LLDFLFVYGTLRKALDGSLHPYLINQAEFIGNATLPGKLYHVGTYPGAVPIPVGSRQCVQGELYRLFRPHLLLQQLDEYEECGSHFPAPHEYLRKQENVSLSDNTHLQAWTYIYQHSTQGLRLVHKGDWRPFLPKSHSNP
jgi:gamma-glutamylcyclotransferase (GGCT)/AIG2-like uncharacterized protein YtfP